MSALRSTFPISSRLIVLFLTVFSPCLGKAEVLQSAYDLAKAPGSAADAPGSLIYGAQAGEQSGSILRNADLNGDGLDDLIVAAPLGRVASPVLRTSCGAVYVWFGKGARDGIRDALGTAGAPPDVTIFGASPNDFCTRNGALAVGDVNGDGIADLLLGAAEGRGAGDAMQSAGEAYIIFGRKSPAAFPAVLDLSLQGPGGADVTIYAGSAFDYLTQNGGLTAGDINGDGVADILIGASGADGPTGADNDMRGEVYIIFGRKSPAVFPTTLNLGVQGSAGADVTIYGASGLTPNVSASGDRLAADGAIITGDLNGDGVLDLIIGAYVANGPGEERGYAGEAYIIFGRKSPVTFPATLDLSVPGPTGADVTITGAATGNYLTDNGDGSRRGGALVTGDFNGDGTTDLLVGAGSAEAPGAALSDNSGAAYIVFGRKSPSPFPATIDLALQDGSWGTTFLGPSASDFVNVVPGSVGDFNGDGVDDFILATFNADGPAEGRSGAGEAYIMFGRRSPANFPVQVYLGGQIGPGADVTIYGATAGDFLTVYGAIATGDLNGDGVADIALGATEADGPADGRNAAGEAYVIFGRKSPSTFPGALDLAAHGSNGADITIYGGAAANRLTGEGALAISDVNDDGTPDLLLGAPAAAGPSGGRASAGRSYVIYGLAPSTPVALRITSFTLSVPPVGESGWRVQAGVSGPLSAAGMTLELQFSDDLATWTTFSNATANNTGTATFDAVDAFAGRTRFYRARKP